MNTKKVQIVKRGYWHLLEPSDVIEEYMCSSCKKYHDWPSPYCPYCGAKMLKEGVVEIVGKVSC